jgi:hypothetical protein
LGHRQAAASRDKAGFGRKPGRNRPRAPLARFLLNDKPAMTIAFEVGESIKERIEYSFNQLMGRTVLRVNGREEIRKTRWFSEPVVDTLELELSDVEKLRVKIEKRRKLLFASQYRVYVNNHLTNCYMGV